MGASPHEGSKIGMWLSLAHPVFFKESATHQRQERRSGHEDVKKRPLRLRPVLRAEDRYVNIGHTIQPFAIGRGRTACCQGIQTCMSMSGGVGVRLKHHFGQGWCMRCSRVLAACMGLGNGPVHSIFVVSYDAWKCRN